MTPIVLVVHAIATTMMAGLIWFVQVVHYPLMARVEPGFVAYEREHVRRTGWIVGPLMLVEMGTAILLAFLLPAGAGRTVAHAGLVLLALLWASTFFVQVPCHRRLERGFDALVHRRLVRTNWARTILWSARAVGAVSLLLPEASIP